MKTTHKTFGFKTESEFHIIDLTDQVLDFIKESGVKNGLVNVQTLHTTTGLLLNENEPLLFEDIKQHFEDAAPKERIYRHDNMTVRTVNVCEDECANGHSHIKASHLCATLTLNLLNGKLQLGRWQRILFIELDRPRSREVQVMVMGE